MEPKPFSGPWSRTEQWALGATGLVTFLLVAAYERAFAMVFVLNFSTEGPNETVLLVLFLLSGLLYVFGLQKHWPHPPRLLGGFAGATLVLSLASLAPNPTLAALASLAVHLAALPLVLTLLTILRARAAIGAGLGVLLHQTVRELLDTAPYYAAFEGRVLFGALAIAFLAVWWFGVQPTLPAPADAPPRPALFLGFVLVQYAFLGSPAAIASWNGDAHLPVALAGAVGVLAGLLAIDLVRRGPDTLLLAVAVFFVGTLLILQAPAFPAGFPLLFAQAAAVLVLYEGLHAPRDVPLRRMGLQLAGFQLVSVVLVFLQVVAGNWAFVAGVGPLLRGQAAQVLSWIGILFLAAAASAVITRKEAPA